jgi:hypothetical protein
MTTLKNEFINSSLFRANAVVENNEKRIEKNRKNLKDGFI